MQLPVPLHAPGVEVQQRFWDPQMGVPVHAPLQKVPAGLNSSTHLPAPSHTPPLSQSRASNGAARQNQPAGMRSPVGHTGEVPVQRVGKRQTTVAPHVVSAAFSWSGGQAS